MAVTFDSLVKEIMENEQAVAIFEELVPGISKNPAMKMIGGMPLGSALKLPQAGFSPEMIEELKVRLAEIE